MKITIRSELDNSTMRKVFRNTMGYSLDIATEEQIDEFVLKLEQEIENTVLSEKEIDKMDRHVRLALNKRLGTNL